MATNNYSCEVIAVYRRVTDNLELRLYRDGECYFVWPDDTFQFGAKDITFEQMEQWLRSENGLGFTRV